MSDLFYTACQPDDEPISEDFLCNELIIPESFEEALSYAEQLIWLYLHKQAELVEGDNITLTDNGDGTVTISAVGGDIKGIDRIDSVVGDTQTTVTVYYTDGTHQSFIVKAGPQGEQGIPGQDGADGVSIVSVTFKETVTQWINTTKDVYTAQGHTGETVQISVPRYSVFTITYSNGTTSEIQVFAGCTIYPYSIVEDFTVTPATHKIYIRYYKPVTNTSVAITDFTITDGAQGAQGPAGQDGADGADGEDGSRFWTTTVAPTTPDYTFTISDLSGVSGETPKVGDYILLSDSNGSHLYYISTVSTTTVLATFVCDLGSAGGGLPSGGANLQVLTQTSTDPAWKYPSWIQHRYYEIIAMLGDGYQETPNSAYYMYLRPGDSANTYQISGTIDLAHAKCNDYVYLNTYGYAYHESILADLKIKAMIDIGLDFPYAGLKTLCTFGRKSTSSGWGQYDLNGHNYNVGASSTQWTSSWTQPYNPGTIQYVNFIGKLTGTSNTYTCIFECGLRISSGSGWSYNSYPYGVINVRRIIDDSTGTAVADNTLPAGTYALTINTDL